MSLPRIKKNGPNKGFWGTQKQIRDALVAALEFGPVQVLTAKAINSGGPLPKALRSWDGRRMTRRSGPTKRDP